MSWYYGWKPYVPVAQRRLKAAKAMQRLQAKGQAIEPVRIEGRKIATSFWGAAWCEHLEGFSDFENRPPRGRTYVRNGSVCHLGIARGEITAKVCGSELYTVSVSIKTLPAKKWAEVKSRCSGQIGSLIELLQGRLSDHVMQVVTDRRDGLFPLPGEMSFKCSCPDWAQMCKHVAAVLYGVGSRLDHQPQLLFTLRGVNHEELIAADAERAVRRATSRSGGRGSARRLAAADVGDVFGIELETGTERDPQGTEAADSASAEPPARRRSSAKRSATARPKSKHAAKAATAAKPKVKAKSIAGQRRETAKRLPAAAGQVPAAKGSNSAGSSGVASGRKSRSAVEASGVRARKTKSKATGRRTDQVIRAGFSGETSVPAPHVALKKSASGARLSSAGGAQSAEKPARSRRAGR